MSARRDELRRAVRPDESAVGESNQPAGGNEARNRVAALALHQPIIIENDVSISAVVMKPHDAATLVSLVAARLRQRPDQN